MIDVVFGGEEGARSIGAERLLCGLKRKEPEPTSCSGEVGEGGWT